jgi:hypothetical protein
MATNGNRWQQMVTDGNRWRQMATAVTNATNGDSRRQIGSTRRTRADVLQGFCILRREQEEQEWMCCKGSEFLEVQ